MKIVAKFGFLILMLLVLGAAFVLPKFVQRSAPPTPQSDLVAALAVVGDETVEPEPAAAEPETSEPAPSSLRTNSRFASFFEALDSQDFERTREIFVDLSKDLPEAEKTELTAQMELAVSAMTLPGESATAPAAVADAPLATLEPLEPQAATTSPAPTPKPTTDPTVLVSFMADVQSGNFPSAKTKLATLIGSVDPATAEMLTTTLATAEAKAAESAAALAQLAASQTELAKLQQESITQMQASVKELAAATQAARAATEEATRLRSDSGSTPAATTPGGDSQPTPKVDAKAITLPEMISVVFGFDSSLLSSDAKGQLTTALEALKAESRLSLQLRGFADSSGPSDYNGMIAKARCEVVRDYFIEQGIAGTRLTVVSFGETQAGTGAPEDTLRRVDVIFRAE
jgi:outer membrane protein OmpA-like peptidoglycan-associated protein